MQTFKSKLEIIGINPFVYLPNRILKEIFKQAGKDKGHIPVCGTINHKEYSQTLIKYKGDWRLYINLSMLNNSPKRIGEIINVEIKFDLRNREIKPHPKLKKHWMKIQKPEESLKIYHRQDKKKSFVTSHL